MTAQLYARVKSVFLEVCDLPSGEQQQALQRLCGGDAVLRAEVEQLLQHYTRENTGTGLSGALQSPEGATFAPSEASPKATRDLVAGTIIAGRYRIATPLGHGGMGEVYRADDLTLDQSVALKFLPPAVAADPTWLAHLQHEVRVARSITHRNICRVHDIVESGTDCFITMAYVDGEDLRSLLMQIGRFPPDKALDIARQLCAGLAAAHARGIIHRDLKPANIMLDSRGQVVIMDFGLAGFAPEINRRQIPAGTVGYRAPEQVAGIEVSIRSDLYSLGLVLYEVFTGKPAMQPGGATNQFARPSALVPDIDPAVERVILQCLEPDPRQRPQSAISVYASLPGGDEVSAALAAGLFPTPEAVASLGGKRHMPRPAAIAGLAAVTVILSGVILLSPRVHPVGRAHLDKSPQTMAAKADELLRELGYAVSERRAEGLTERLDCPFLKAKTALASDLRYSAGPDPVLVFWRRTGRDHLVPVGIQNVVFGTAQVTAFDPAPDDPGMTSVALDARGRLLGLGIVSPLPDAPSYEAAWARLIAWAGLDRATLAPAEPITVPRIEADRRTAWLGPHPDDAKTPIRVEAATNDGQIVSFAVLDAALHKEKWFIDLAYRKAFIQNIRTILILFLAIASIPLVRRNMRFRQSDPKGAIRLAGFVFAARLLAWMLQAHHVPVLTVELSLLNAAVAGALTEAAVVWLFYMALEPLLRRYWPETLTSWNRLIGGQIRDPLVGSSLLWGAALGTSWALLIQIDSLLTPWLGLNPRPGLRPEAFFSALMSSRQALGFCLDAIPKVIYESLLLLLLLVILRAVLRRAWPARIVGGLLIALLIVPRGTNPAVSWVLIGLGAVAPGIYFLTRYGLVPVITALFIAVVLLRFPLTLDRQVWYADHSLFAILITATIAIWGFATARGAKAVAG